ncbi:MAG: hypothetical protein IT493_16260 [Gammaproteobacteria bacterium]|nr:hypothetical protein [Gammaproteobacteria bacterium]
MLGNEAQAATTFSMSNPFSQTATYNGSWYDVREYVGDLMIVQHVGAVTGSITGKIQHASDGSGTGAEDITGAAFTLVNAANNIQKLTIPADSTLGWIRYVGTIVTGPANVAVSASGRKKYV